MSLAKGLVAFTESGVRERPDLTVVTPTPCGDSCDRQLPFCVIRQPSLPELIRLIQTSDVIHLAGPCFLPMLLGLLIRKPVVVEHSLYQAVCPNGLLLDERTKALCPGHFMAGSYGECLRCNAANHSWWKSLSMLLLTFPRRWMCGKVAQHITPTSHVSKRVNLPRTTTIYHGINQPRNVQRSVDHYLKQPVCFAYVGRLVSEKGLNLLLEAAGRLNVAGCSFRLKFIGDGPERARLTERVDLLGLRRQVAFTGLVQGQDLEKALHDVAVVIMPSICEETAGLSAMENMMRGRTVIAADIGGLGELVGDAGLKFPVGDAESLAWCMMRVLRESSLAKDLGEKAERRAQAFFREERMVAEHFAVYRELLGESRRDSCTLTAT
jgi:glycosyltransferase involved in cell wall biosynthesis